MRAPAVLLLTLCVALPAAARPDDDGKSAQQRFDNGERAFNLGRFKEAAEQFTLAYEISGDRTLLYNLAQAYRFGGDMKQACLFYKTFLASYARRRQVPPFEREVRQRVTSCDAAQPEPPPVPMVVPAPTPTAPVVTTPVGTAPVGTAPAAATPVAAAPVAAPRPRLRLWGVEGVTLGAVVTTVGVGLLAVGVSDASNSVGVARPTTSYEAVGAVVGLVGVGAVVAGTIALVRASRATPTWASRLPSLAPGSVSWSTRF